MLINNPTDVYDVSSATNLDYVNPMGGKKKNYSTSNCRSSRMFVIDTKRICNSNHSRSASCTSGCIPLNLAKLNSNQLFLSVKSNFFYLILY